ncbi:hypothetical protein SAMN04488515_3189 [Cognatiyoonia koreensis]|uniref:O-antigen ligase like membrane protein n=1 Tax=Cognatiyoonia koreensis TaxID=364200 RepID=A0A1I0RT26_9RHOB|nr:hypothetical protein [Cognatiyoonia koreensis]SEW44400.1 hypothetical protein SAMN04488515_3189 [Cognatiyoonia koreensis]
MIGWIALSVWPVIGIILFNKLKLPAAICSTIFGGFLLLPERIGLDLPVLPTLDKHSIPVVTALIMTSIVLLRPRQWTHTNPGWVPRSIVVLAFIVLLFIGTFGTVLTNQDPLVYGSRYLSGMKLYDGFSFSLSIVITLIPLIIARKALASPQAQRTLLIALAVSALAYSAPALWEIRMSPQLHRQIYGFFQHSFNQQIRAGGFRSMVFLSHGLTLSMFFCLAILASAALARTSGPAKRIRWWALVGFLTVVLILNKTLGALAITLLVLPLMILLRARAQLLVAACIAGIVMTYPLLRAANVIPVDRVVALAESIDPARASSLSFRLRNEDILLEKARERPFFGWGGWSRNRVYNDAGRDLSVTDGVWVIHFGVGGWFRYIGFFGLLCWPIIALFISKRDRLDPYSAALALILAAKLLDMIPNAGSDPYVWLIVGSLIGRLELASLKTGTSKQDPDVAPNSKPQYRRKLTEPPEGEPDSSAETPVTRDISYTRAKTIRHRRTSS